MTTDQRIRKAMVKGTNWTKGEINAAQVYKSWHHGTDYGWIIKPFNGQEIFLGENQAQALETIKNWYSA